MEMQAKRGNEIDQPDGSESCHFLQPVFLMVYTEIGVKKVYFLITL